MTFRPELIDELLKDYRSPDDLMGESGIVKQLTKALIDRCHTDDPTLEAVSDRADHTVACWVKPNGAEVLEQARAIAR